MRYDDCIAAIATDHSRPAGVGVVRLSGKGSFSVGEKVFRAAGGKAFGELPAREAVYGRIDAGGYYDLGLCVKFAAPKSFTGEDVVELHCHGGREVVAGVLASCIAAGARPAENGEFTRRAFLNGKLDLSACEGVGGMIHARSRAEAAASAKLLGGELQRAVSECQESLENALAAIEAALDYPEEDIPEFTTAQAAAALGECAARLEALEKSYGRGKKIRDGVSVVLCGGTNSGKSSLFNRLLGEERAIVTDIPGTTRDVVEGELELGGLRVVLSDTAGLRDSGDEVENLGMTRTVRALSNADAVLLLRGGDGAEEARLTSLIPPSAKVIAIHPKSDLPEKAPRKGDIFVSARTGDGVEELLAALTDAVSDGMPRGGGLVLLTERHYDAVRRARNAALQGLSGIEHKLLDMLAADVRECWEILGEITGVNASETIIDAIFSKFCLGK